MSVAYTTDPRGIWRLAAQENAPSRLEELARLAERLAIKAENAWDELPIETREAFASFAYGAIQGPKGTLSNLRLFWWRVKLGYNVARGREEMHAVTEYIDSVQRLINAVLGAIEREDECRQEVLATAVDQALGKQGRGEILTAEETCEWLKSVSRRALG